MKRQERCLRHLGLGVNLSPSVQQEPHHDHIPPSGSDVQRSDTILQGNQHMFSDGQGEWSLDRRYLSNDSYSPYLWGEVDIGSSIEQQLSHIQVFIMCSNMEGRKSSLPGHIRERKLEQLIYFLLSHTYQYQ